MQRHKVVLDTNLFIAAFFNKKSFSYKILNMAKRNEISLIVSDEILKEINHILRNIKPNSSFKNKINLILKKAKLIKNIPKVKEIKKDFSDNKFLATAFAGKADFIISNDKHLLSLKKFYKIEILTPKNFLKKIKKS